MRLLIVNDREPLLRILSNWLRTQNGPDGEPLTVDTEMSYVEAVQRIESGSRYDAVIVDDPPASDIEKLALDVIRACGNRRLVGIVLTAYGDLSRCVEFMRVGGWDYLRKDAPERLHEKIVASLDRAAEYRHLFKPDPNAEWIEKHRDELLAEYAGKYIVVHAGKVVQSSHSYIEVAQGVRAFTRGTPFIFHVTKP